MRDKGFARRLIAASLILATLVVAGPWAWRRMRPLPSLVEVRAWVSSEQWDRAAEAIAQHLERRPHDTQTLIIAAQIAGSRREFERCADLLSRVPENSPGKPEAMFRQGQALLEGYYAQRAERVWLAALERARKRPGNRSVRLAVSAELAALYGMERRVSEARALLWEMYSQQTEKWRLLIWLARLGNLDPQVALKSLDRFVESDCTDVDARLGRARYLMQLFKWQEALDEAMRCVEQDAVSAAALGILLRCYCSLQQWEAAEEILSHPKLDQSSPEVSRLRALCYKAKDDWANAESCFEESLRLDPYDPVTHFQYAQFLAAMNERQRAQHHAERSKVIQEQRSELFRHLVTYTDQSDWEPPTPEQCVEFAKHLRAIGRVREARGWLDEALLQRPDFPAAIHAREELDRSPATNEAIHVEPANHS